MFKLFRLAGALAAAALAAAACSDPLSVNNTNNPGRENIFAIPRDVESLAGRLYQNVHTATLGANDAVYPQMLTMSFESASSLNNFNMGPRGGIPRAVLDNSPGNNAQIGNLRDFQRQQNTAGTAQVIIDKVNSPGFTLNDTLQDRRLRSFAYFGLGVALGNVALVYDSASIPRPNATADSAPSPLAAYDSVMRTALRSLDSAQVYAGRIGTTAIPAAWLAQASDVSVANYVRIIRSYKARFRADVARTPEERAQVDWDAVIADATNGIQQNFTLELNPSGGWDYAWLIQHFATGSANWHQMTPYFIGMADSSGNYDRWLATPRDNREAFTIFTADRRFPRGATRAAQQASSVASTTTNVPADTFVYFRNRASAEDQPGAPWAVSQYDHNRWRALFRAARIGTWPTFTRAENDMLAAEGYIRRGNVASALPLIDRTRTRNSLPALSGAVTAVGQVAPGGASCVPRVPDAARGWKATKCGDAFDAMKYEKRLESAFAGYGVWFFNGRGWGDLAEGTPLQWPVPFQEMNARRSPFYSLGGIGGRSAAAASQTYGFGTADR